MRQAGIKDRLSVPEIKSANPECQPRIWPEMHRMGLIKADGKAFTKQQRLRLQSRWQRNQVMYGWGGKGVRRQEQGAREWRTKEQVIAASQDDKGAGKRTTTCPPP